MTAFVKELQECVIPLSSGANLEVTMLFGGAIEFSLQPAESLVFYPYATLSKVINNPLVLHVHKDLAPLLPGICNNLPKPVQRRGFLGPLRCPVTVTEQAYGMEISIADHWLFKILPFDPYVERYCGVKSPAELDLVFKGVFGPDCSSPQVDTQAPEKALKPDPRPKAQDAGRYLIVWGDAIAGFKFYGPFKTEEEAANFNVNPLMLDFPGLITSFEKCGLNSTEPAFSEEECKLVRKAMSLCAVIGNAAPDDAGRASFRGLADKLNALQEKMENTTK